MLLYLKAVIAKGLDIGLRPIKSAYASSAHDLTVKNTAIHVHRVDRTMVTCGIVGYKDQECSDWLVFVVYIEERGWSVVVSALVLIDWSPHGVEDVLEMLVHIFDVD